MKKSKIKAIILDCDGVILKSNKAYEQLYERLCKKYGINKKAKDIYPLFGENPRKVIEKLFHRRNVDNAYNEYNSHMKEKDFLGRIKIYKGAKRSIARLSRKYRLAVASGAVRARLRPSLHQYSVLKYLDFVISGEDVRQGKPNPDMLNKCVKALHVKKSETIFVGDAPADVIAAKRANIVFVAVLTGILNRKMAKKMKADYIVSDITKVEKVVEKINST